MATMQEVMRLSDPLKSYQFRVTIANAPGTGASGELLQFRCTATVLPGRTIDPVTTSLDGFDITDAGKVSGALTWTCTFAEGTDIQVIRKMQNWQDIVYNPETGVQATRDEYKRVATIEMYNNAKETSLVRTIKGVLTQAIDDITLDKSTSDNVTVGVTFSYDYHTTA